MNVNMNISSDTSLVRDSARSFAARRKDHAALRAGRSNLPWHEQSRLKEMAELGWFGALIPEAFGGIGLLLSEMAVISEELGAALLCEPLAPLAVLAPKTILLGDNDDLKSRILPKIAAGSHFVALAWQEGNDDIRNPARVSTVAERDGDSWRLTGKKRFVAGAWAADGFIVSAVAGGEFRLFYVDANCSGVKVAHEWRADGSPTGLITLVDVLVAGSDIAASQLVAEAALKRALDEAALIVAAEAIGVSRSAFDLTVAYMRTRVAFGRPLAGFQALQHRVADLLVQRTLAESTLAAALRVADGPNSDVAIGLAVSRAKIRCNEAVSLTTRQAVQLHGGMGFTDECDVGLYLKRALVLTAWLGTTAAHLSRLEKHLDFDVDKPAAASPSQDADDTLLRRMQTKAVADRDWNALSDKEFRSCARSFFSTNVPQHLRFLPHRLGWKDIGDYYMLLSREGWLAPLWPASYGGMGLGPAKLIIFYEENERIGAPRVLDHGLNNVGSILLTRGTEEQRQRYLPKVLSGEHIWCQGYSEPNAGSDLASLRTEAYLDGDEFVVTGQKIWTSFAHEANHIYALVRTDKSKPGRDGISFLLIDMKQPGITVRRIKNITGNSEFNEVFLDGVRTHRSNMVGGLNEGWAVSRAVLGFERLRAGMPRVSISGLQRLTRVARRVGLDKDPLFRDRLTRLSCDVADLGALYERLAEQLKAGVAPGPEASVLKIVATELEQKLTETLVEILADAGTLSGAQNFDDLSVNVLTPFLYSRAATIYGGTTEIQRNIISRRILAL